MKKLFKEFMKFIAPIVFIVVVMWLILYFIRDDIRHSEIGLNIEEICIENHVYFFVGESSLAAKLNDNGKPVKCEE